MAKKTERQSRHAAYFPLEFPISKARWEFYGLDKDFLPAKGEAAMPDFHLFHEMVKRIYERRDLAAFSQSPLRAGHLNAAGLINEIYRCIIAGYCATINPTALQKGLLKVKEELSDDRSDSTIGEFVELFPPKDILQGQESLR
ncbi:MAG: hypothetical protein P8123_10920, partial [bacterium]